MRIGLLTVHCSTNFGGSLQAYALYEYLKRFGSTEIINYRFDGFIDSMDKSKKNYSKTKRIVKSLLYKKQCEGRIKKFSEFEANCLDINDSVVNIHDFSKLDTEFDYVVVGSDQVWNPEHILFDSTFLLSQIEPVKKVSYAASIGKESLNDDEVNFLKENLLDFKNISVREKKSAQLLNCLLDRTDVRNNIDPVFLLEIDKWIDIERKVPGIPDQYALVYVLGECDTVYGMIKVLQNEGLKIVCIQGELKSKYGDINLYDIGPREFIYLIRNASMVITNSFHGTAFSIIFKKKQVILKSKKLNLRLENLLNEFNVPLLQIETKEEYFELNIDAELEKIKLHAEEKIQCEKEKAEKYFLDTFKLSERLK